MPDADPTTTAEVTTTTTVSNAETSTTESPDHVPGEGIIAVRLEPVEGFFIEGFEVGLRVETAGGERIAATLWSDFVQSQDDEPTLEAYYQSVLEQPVPAGEVVVWATANVGTGPGPEIPDIEGDLRCQLSLHVAEGERVEVEVSFAAGTECLRSV